MLIQTDQLPDIISVHSEAAQIALLEDNYMVLSLENLAEMYAPDFIYPESQTEWNAGSDGEWYRYADFYQAYDNIAEGMILPTHNQNSARKDILEDIGMTYDDLKTKDGFLAALRAVKEAAPEYNGKVVTPWLGVADGADIFFAEQFGASSETPEGKYQSIFRAEEYLESILFLNTMYREGLTTDECLTMKDEQVEEEVAAGHVFATTKKGIRERSREALYANDNEAQMLYAGVMGTEEGVTPSIMSGTTGGYAMTLINKNAINPMRCIQLFAYLSQPETGLDDFYGVGAYEVIDGKVHVTEEALAMQAENMEEFKATYKGNFPWVYDHTAVVGNTTAYTDTVFGRDDEISATHNDFTVYDGKAFHKVIPPTGTAEASTYVKIMEFKEQALGRMVTAASEEACIAEYNSMIEQLDALGLAELETYQDGLFQENKEKLGLEFANPSNIK